MAEQYSTDVLTPEQRSYCMSRIRGKDTKPEVKLRKALWALGYRYRLQYQLPGKPDIVFPGRKVAIFVDGCFWHKCPRHFKWPKTNFSFWQKKICANEARDKRVTDLLLYKGWRVLRFWEHEVTANTGDVIEQVVLLLRNIDEINKNRQS